MGAICCKGIPEWNPDGTQKSIQTDYQFKNDPNDLRQAAKNGELESMHDLLRRMPKHQITSGATASEVNADEIGNTALHFAVGINHLRGCKKLVLYGGGLNVRNEEGKSPLHIAVEAGNRKATTFLLSKGAQINAKDKMGDTPLTLAFALGDKSMVKWLLSWTPDSSFANASKAAAPPERGDGEDLKEVPDAPFKMGSLKINQGHVNKAGATMLTLAARNGWWDIVKFFLSGSGGESKTGVLGRDIDKRSKDGETVLGWVLKYAVSKSIAQPLALKLVTLLLSKGASPHQPCFSEDVPPLALAAASGYMDVYKILKEKAGGTRMKADGTAQFTLEARDGMDRTVLHYAAAKGNLQVVRDLLRGERAFIPASSLDRHRDTPLHLAALRGHDQVCVDLLQSIEDDEPENLIDILTKPNSSGLTVLHLAVSGSCLPNIQQSVLSIIAKLLPKRMLNKKEDTLQMRVDNNVMNTPLLLAVSSHQHAVVKKLIEANVDVHMTNAKGENALIRCLASVTKATEALDASILSLLLKAGASPRPPGFRLWPKKGQAVPPQALHPLLSLCMNDCNEFAEMAIREVCPLFEGGMPKWTMKDKQGRRPLHLAALYNNAYLCKYLLEVAKVPINDKCSHGRTPLMYAAINGSVDAMKILLNRGPDLHLEDKTRKSALAHCLTLDKPETLTCAALLLRKGVKPMDCKDTIGEGLLHKAVRYGLSDFIRLWQKHGGNMRLACTTGITADDVPRDLKELALKSSKPKGEEKGGGCCSKAPVVLDEEIGDGEDILDEVEVAMEESVPGFEDEEEEDNEEEECAKTKERRIIEGQPVGEAGEDLYIDPMDAYWTEEAPSTSYQSPDNEPSLFEGPSLQLKSQWQKQGTKWWDLWLGDVEEEALKHADDDVFAKIESRLKPMEEDWYLETQDGEVTMDDIVWEVLERRKRGESVEGEAVAEGLLSIIKTNATNASGDEHKKEDSTLEKAQKLLKELHEDISEAEGLKLQDPYYAPGPKMYKGSPAYELSTDCTDLPEGTIPTLIEAMHDRMHSYIDKADPVLIGDELRKRNIVWWIKSLCAEEYPMKVGKWPKLFRMTADAVKRAVARKPRTAKEVPEIRKRTVWFGLPELPNRPELEQTTALIYAVRLGRVSCVRALLDVGARTTLHDRDLWGHSPTEYAMFLYCKEKRNKDLQQMVDMLLYACPDVNEELDWAQHNHMNPLCLAIVINDQSRVAWLARMCGAALDRSWVNAPDIPAYLQGRCEAVVGGTDGRLPPVHWAVMQKQDSLLKLVLALGASPNGHSWGYIGKVPYKLRESWLDILMKCKLKGKSLDGPRKIRRELGQQEKMRSAAYARDRKAGKKGVLMKLALTGLNIANKAGQTVLSSDIPFTTYFMMIKNMIQDLISGPDPWVSPLHIAARCGQASAVLILLSKGAPLDGGSRMARRTPIEEALKFARSNFTHDYLGCKRHNWKVVQERVAVIPEMSKKARINEANSVFQKALRVLGDPVALMIKQIIQAAKAVISKLLDIIRRPMAHFDPAMAAVHILLRKYCFMSAEGVHTGALIRNIQDNGTWFWINETLVVDDRKWLNVVDEEMSKMEKDKSFGYAKLAKTDDYKEYHKVVKTYKRKSEQHYITEGATLFWKEYQVRCRTSAKSVSEALQETTKFNTIRVTNNIYTAFTEVTRVLYQDAMFGDSVTEELKKWEAEHKEMGVLFSEDMLLVEGREDLKLPEFDPLEPETFLGASYSKLMPEGSSKLMPAPNHSSQWSDLRTPEVPKIMPGAGEGEKSLSRTGSASSSSSSEDDEDENEETRKEREKELERAREKEWEISLAEKTEVSKSALGATQSRSQILNQKKTGTNSRGFQANKMMNQAPSFQVPHTTLEEKLGKDPLGVSSALACSTRVLAGAKAEAPSKEWVEKLEAQRKEIEKKREEAAKTVAKSKKAQKLLALIDASGSAVVDFLKVGVKKTMQDLEDKLLPDEAQAQDEAEIMLEEVEADPNDLIRSAADMYARNTEFFSFIDDA